MLTLPSIVERPDQPYVAVAARVAMKDMVPVVDAAFGTLHRWLGANGVEVTGPAFFRYRLIDMDGEMEIEFAMPVAATADISDDAVTAGTLPAGRYAQVTWTGPYHHLMDVNAVLVGWGQEKGLRWDMDAAGERPRFAWRIEVYENHPGEVADASELVTTVAIRLAD